MTVFPQTRACQARHVHHCSDHLSPVIARRHRIARAKDSRYPENSGSTGPPVGKIRPRSPPIKRVASYYRWRWYSGQPQRFPCGLPSTRAPHHLHICPWFAGGTADCDRCVHSEAAAAKRVPGTHVVEPCRRALHAAMHSAKADGYTIGQDSDFGDPLFAARHHRTGPAERSLTCPATSGQVFRDRSAGERTVEDAQRIPSPMPKPARGGDLTRTLALVVPTMLAWRN